MINDSFKKAIDTANNSTVCSRSSRLQVFCKLDVLKNLTKSTWKHVVLEACKFTCLQHATVFKKRVQHWCFPMNFAKFYGYFFTEHLQVKVTTSCSLFFAKYAVQSMFWNKAWKYLFYSSLRLKILWHQVI